MHTIKMMLAVLALLVVAACGGNNLVPKTPEQAVFGLTSSYSVLLDAAGRYNNLPRCKSGKQEVAACSSPDVVKQLRDYDKNAQGPLETAQKCSRQGLTGDIMTDSINALKAILVGYKNLVYKTQVSIPDNQKSVVDTNVN